MLIHLYNDYYAGYLCFVYKFNYLHHSWSNEELIEMPYQLALSNKFMVAERIGTLLVKTLIKTPLGQCADLSWVNFKSVVAQTILVVEFEKKRISAKSK